MKEGKEQRIEIKDAPSKAVSLLLEMPGAKLPFLIFAAPWAPGFLFKPFVVAARAAVPPC